MSISTDFTFSITESFINYFISEWMINNDFTYTGIMLKKRLAPASKSKIPKEEAFMVACNRPHKSLKRKIPAAARTLNPITPTLARLPNSTVRSGKGQKQLSWKRLWSRWRFPSTSNRKRFLSRFEFQYWSWCIRWIRIIGVHCFCDPAVFHQFHSVSLIFPCLNPWLQRSLK